MKGQYMVDLSSDDGEPQRLAWRRDVALEISVDAESAPAIIRLVGTLDRETAFNVVALVAELIRDGYNDFELKTSGLCVPDEGGMAALLGLKLLVQQSGGHLVWGGSTANRQLAGTDNES